MSERVTAELTLLRRVHPGLEFLPPGWSHKEVAIAFRVPPSVAVQPYGFWVYPSLSLADGRQTTNYTAAVEIAPRPNGSPCSPALALQLESEFGMPLLASDPGDGVPFA